MSLQKNANTVIIKQKRMNLCLRRVQYTYHHLMNLKVSLPANNANNDFDLLYFNFSIQLNNWSRWRLVLKLKNRAWVPRNTSHMMMTKTSVFVQLPSCPRLVAELQQQLHQIQRHPQLDHYPAGQFSHLLFLIL